MNRSETSQWVPHQKLINVNSGSDYHIATFQGELQTTGVTVIYPLDRGDLWLPGVGGDFVMGRSLIQGVCHERIHLTAHFRKPENGWPSAALACSTKHEADIHETSELIPLRSQCSTYSKAGNTRDLRIFQWFGPCFQRSQIIIGKWDFSFFWDIMQRRLIVNDVSEQPIGPIIKDHDCLSLKEFIDRSSRNVYNKLSRYVCVTSQNSKDLIT